MRYSIGNKAWTKKHTEQYSNVDINYKPRNNIRGITNKTLDNDSNSIPEPWEMPGYTDKVIMAAGAFTQGSSIELSCDGPIRAPYIAFMQGGLTYEYGKIGVLKAISRLG